MLSDQFEEQARIDFSVSTHPYALMAESICARMADVEMYAFLIQDARDRHDLAQVAFNKENHDTVAILTRSFTIGMLGACKALLDSGAATLTLLHELPLTTTESRFDNSDFWHQFVVHAPNIHRRYHPLRLFFNEITRWCNTTPHRVPPVATLHDHFGQWSSREMKLKVVNDDKADIVRLADAPLQFEWIDALELHRRWKPQLLMLCEKLCADISRKLAK
ncbi:MAG: hypothetical protein AAF639_25655 [Chloroflexota bacterium]